MYCRNCGTFIPENAETCPGCGMPNMQVGHTVYANEDMPPMQPETPFEQPYTTPMQPEAPPAQPSYKPPVQPGAPPAQPYMPPAQPAAPPAQPYMPPVQPAQPHMPPVQPAFQPVPGGVPPQNGDKKGSALIVVLFVLAGLLFAFAVGAFVYFQF